MTDFTGPLCQHLILYQADSERRGGGWEGGGGGEREIVHIPHLLQPQQIFALPYLSINFIIVIFFYLFIYFFYI